MVMKLKRFLPKLKTSTLLNMTRLNKWSDVRFRKNALHLSLQRHHLLSSRSWLPNLAKMLTVVWVLVTSTSVAAELLISSQATNCITRIGQPATFSIAATGEGVLKYQWLADGVEIPGAVNTTLVVTNAQFSNAIPYSVIVTAGSMAVTSNPVAIQFLHPADTSPGDFNLSEIELAAYVAKWRDGGLADYGPNPIPNDYVSRAAYLQQSAISYTFSTNNGPPPLCWLPGGLSGALLSFSDSLIPIIATTNNGTFESAVSSVTGLRTPSPIEVTPGTTVLINGAAVGPDYLLRNGDRVQLRYSGMLPSADFLMKLTAGNISRSQRIISRSPRSLPPPPSGVASGSTEGSFDVTESGAATYSIPIVVPQGVGGLTPQISIAYTSQGRDGILGVGWNLGGLSAISRAPKTIESDGFRGSVQVDNGDRFVLDGQALILVPDSSGKSPGYGADGAEYRTRRESFQQIHSFSQKGDGPEYFTVKTKAGLRLEFGGTTDSRVVGNGSGPETVMLWALNKVTDTFGNSYLIAYDQPQALEPFRTSPTLKSTGAQYVRKITYANGKAEIIFDYADLDPAEVNTTIGFTVGAYAWRTKRLMSIASYYDGKRVRQYDFGFSREGLIGRKFLTSVTERGFNDMDTHQPTRFVYNTDTPVDSDGTQKVKLSFYSTDSPKAYTDNAFRINGQLMPGSGEGHSDERIDNINRLRYADFDGDGRRDILQIRGNNGIPAECYIYLNKGDGFSRKIVGPRLKIKKPETAEDPDLSGQIQFGDFNGDGKEDIFLLKEAGQEQNHQILYFKGSGFGDHPDPYRFEPGPFISDNVQQIDVRSGRWFSTLVSAVRFLDVDGDGRTDIYVIREERAKTPSDDGNDDLYINEGGGQFRRIAGIPSRMRREGDDLRGASTAIARYRFDDFTGDGKVDIYAVRGYDSTARLGSLFIFQDNFYGALPPWERFDGVPASVRTLDEALIDIGSVMNADFNGDGLADILKVRRNNGEDAEATIFFSKGDGTWTDPVRSNVRIRIRDGLTFGQMDLSRVKLADMNGDGKMDIYYVVGKGDEGIHDKIYLSLGDGQFTPAIQGIKTVVDDTLDPIRTFGQISQTEQPDPDGKVDLAAILIADFNGDGRADIGNIDQGFNLRLRHQKLQFPELLTEVQNGHGQRTRIEYSTLTEVNPVEADTVGRGGFSPAGPDFYEVNDAGLEPLQYPLIYLRGPIFLVSKVLALNGIGGTNSSTYKYRNGMLNVIGGGFQGFAEFIVRDEVSGRESTVTFSHEAFQCSHLLPGRFNLLRGYTPFAGIPIRQTQRIPKEGSLNLKETVIVSETIQAMGLWQYHKRYSPHVGSMTNRTFELTDFLLSNAPPPIKTHVTLTEVGRVGPVAGLVQGVSDGAPLDANAFFGNVSLVTELEYDGEATGDPHFSTTTTNEYRDDVSKWHLGRLARLQVTKQDLRSPDGPMTRVSGFEYSPENGALTAEILEPDRADANWHLKRYIRESRGNITSSVQSAVDQIDRALFTEFDVDGRLIVATRNALGHEERYVNDPRLGLKVSHQGPNGLVSRWMHDGFGRTRIEQRPDGTSSQSTYLLLESNPPVDAPSRLADGMEAFHYVQTDLSSGGTSRIFYDILDREVRRTSSGLDGRRIAVDTIYNAKGEVEKRSEPFFVGDTTRHYTIHEYDHAGRPKKITSPGDRVSTLSYSSIRDVAANGIMSAFLGAKTTNPLMQDKLVVKDVRGRMVRSVDHLGNAVQYSYDVYDQPLNVVDPSGNSTQFRYSLRGNKIWQSDPDVGVITYSYNGFGELIYQRDNLGNEIRNEYDRIGRIVLRREPEGITRWTYDIGGRAIGKLVSVTFQENNGATPYTVEHRFDQLCRPVQSIEHILVNGEMLQFSSAVAFDEESRPEIIEYPLGYRVRLEYGPAGHQTSVRENSSGVLIWEALSQTARGQVELARLGADINTRTLFNEATGLPQAIQAHTIAGSSFASPDLQDYRCDFDAAGNLKYREDRRAGTNLREDFSYDVLNRLTNWVTGAHIGVAQYDAIGNITSKTGVGEYSYGSDRPHAVSAVSGLGLSYRYDGNGNRIETWRGLDRIQRLTYGSHNLPVAIESRTNRMEFGYALDRHRYLQRIRDLSGALKETKVYAGTGFELESKDGVIKYTYYITGGGQTVAAKVVTSTGTGSSSKLSLFLRDHLGSLQVIVDPGGVLTRLSYDAWGRRRDPVDWAVVQPGLRSDVDRGFTGHEHLEEFELIHMNGRVYDPVVGRFLSADPFVQDSTDLQNLNRYSYVLNNPLSATDPTGQLFAWLARKLFGDTIGNLVGIAESIALALVPGVGHAYAIAMYAANSFVESFAGSLANGGGFGDSLTAGLKSAAITAASAGASAKVEKVFGQVGSFAHEAKRAIVHGVTQGAISKVGGGNFVHGFVTESLGSLADSFGESMESTGIGKKILFNSSGAFLAGRKEWLSVAVDVVAGATASKINGDSFINGAKSSAVKSAVGVFTAHLHHALTYPWGKIDKANGDKSLDLQDWLAQFITGGNGLLAGGNIRGELPDTIKALHDYYVPLWGEERFNLYMNSAENRLFLTHDVSLSVNVKIDRWKTDLELANRYPGIMIRFVFYPLGILRVKDW